jgi:glycosyltransferase involved in cell wall biosynthesis
MIKVSVIVCTRNEGRNIGRCLESLQRQNYPKEALEILVVDNASNDKTREIARRYTAKVYSLPREVDLSTVKNFRGAQLNLGVSRSSGELIFYPDADMTFDPDLVREAVSFFDRVDALYVPEVVCGRGVFGRVRNFERSFYVGTCIDAVRFVRREVFAAVGGFDERRIAFGFDDWDFSKSIRAKHYRLGTTKHYLYHHEDRLNLRTYLRKKRRYARTAADYIAKWGRDDPDIRRQFSPYYRFWGIFTEEGKWRRLLSRPHLALGVFALRLLVGLSFFLSDREEALCLWRD